MTSIQVEDIWAIEAPGAGYASAPTLTKTQNGELMAVYSGGRKHHVCPFGQVHLITSRDEGKTWTWPRVLIDGAIDDRDAGILQTRNGTLIVNWFTSFAWEWVMDNGSSVYHGGKPIKLTEVEAAEWERRRARLTDEVRLRELGAWSIRSTDGGASWSPKVPTQTGSPHGPCELSDGRLLYVGKKTAQNMVEAEAAQTPSQGSVGGPYAQTVGASESTDDGKSWQLIGEIHPMPGHDIKEYHELHAVEAADGTIIAHIRNHNKLNQYEVLQTESRDGGRTWSIPHLIGIWGYPPFLIKASDGRLISSLSHRREPHGNFITISEDNGKSWAETLRINTDSWSDFGYPSTVELSPGRFLSLWYDMQDRDLAFLRLARWTLR
jgi:hypothetical protein